MLCEVRPVVGILALLSVSEAFVVNPSATAEPAPVVSPDPISTALCGRGEGSYARLANALDKLDLIVLPPIWQDVEAEKLQRWLNAPICPRASESEANLYRSRRMTLDQIVRRLQRAKVTEQIGSTLARFRGWRLKSEEWPFSSECNGCAALRSSTARVADIASRWSFRTSTKVGTRLGEAAKLEPLVAELCAAMPLPGVRAEIERRFRYYSWTDDGVKLLEVAAWFEQFEVVAGCRSR
jgi:hypothetical protein